VKPTNGTLRTVVVGIVVGIFMLMVGLVVAPDANTEKVEQNSCDIRGNTSAIKENEAADREFRAAANQRLEQILRTLERVEDKLEK